MNEWPLLRWASIDISINRSLGYLADWKYFFNEPEENKRGFYLFCKRSAQNKFLGQHILGIIIVDLIRK